MDLPRIISQLQYHLEDLKSGSLSDPDLATKILSNNSGELEEEAEELPAKDKRLMKTISIDSSPGVAMIASSVPIRNMNGQIIAGLVDHYAIIKIKDRENELGDPDSRDTSMQFFRSKGWFSSSIFPPSIFEKSRMSLMTDSNEFPLLLTVST